MKVQKEPIWQKPVKECPHQKQKLVIRLMNLERNMSQKCIRNEDNINTTQPIKNIWMRKTFHVCAKDEITIVQY